MKTTTYDDLKQARVLASTIFCTQVTELARDLYDDKPNLPLFGSADADRLARLAFRYLQETGNAFESKQVAGDCLEKWFTGNADEKERLGDLLGSSRMVWQQFHKVGTTPQNEVAVAEDYFHRQAADFMEKLAGVAKVNGKLDDFLKLWEEGPRRRTKEPPPVVDDWPAPPDEVAFHGLAGKVVNLIAPASEADRAALLVQLLVAVGNAAGRHCYFTAEADRHYTNEYACIVGLTGSAGRKGTSWGWVRRFMRKVMDPAWCDAHVTPGLSSGEGLINAARNLCLTNRSLLAFQAEFAAPIKLMDRNGTTLGTFLRELWETDRAVILTKSDPMDVKDIHFSMIAHITPDEVRKLLQETDKVNGFANRFLWCCSRRSKKLPFGGEVDTAALSHLAHKVKVALDWAGTDREMGFSPQASKLYEAEYEHLTRDRGGMAAAMAGRVEAHVKRLALIYAMLDRSPSGRILEVHLRAALALWNYCERSVSYIFGDSVGDETADAILRGLRAQPGGMTMAEIYAHLGGGKKKPEVHRALAVLRQHGLATSNREKTGGRTAETWKRV